MKSQIWNIIFAAIVTAFLGCLGYLLTSISDLEKKEASRQALEFTSKDAVILQQKLTDVMTDIDLRISLIERDIQWVKMFDGTIPKPPKFTIDEPGSNCLPPEPPVPMPTMEPSPQQQSPRYDLRK